jgi:hypothetical protein
MSKCRYQFKNGSSAIVDELKEIANRKSITSQLLKMG